MDKILEKLKEKSTWAGLFSILAAFGLTISPELDTAITAVGIAIAGLVSVSITEEKK